MHGWTDGWSYSPSEQCPVTWDTEVASSHSVTGDKNLMKANHFKTKKSMQNPQYTIKGWQLKSVKKW